ncbi:MAG: hypothetical protein ABEJ73_02050 [Haloplanus sp.]
MPSASSATNWQVVGVALVALVVTYAVLIAQRVLLGVFLGALVYLVVWLIARLSPGHPLDDMSRTRTTATAVFVVLVLAYAGLIAANVLLGVVAAVTVAVVAWVTSPGGPVARWLGE